MSTSIIPSAAASKFEFVDLDPDDIWIADGRRKRPLDLKDEDDQMFIDSIRKTPGNRQPIEVRATPQAARPYELITGRRRMAACKYLGRPVLAKVIEIPDEQVAFYAVTENLLRKRMSDVERLKFIKQMFRDMERIFGPDPGKSQNNAAWVRKNRRDGDGRNFVAKSRLEPDEAGDNLDGVASSPTAGLDAAADENHGKNGENSGGGPSSPTAGLDADDGNESDAGPKSHTRIYQDITGRKRASAFADRALAEKFTEEQLQLLLAVEVTQAHLVELSRLEPEGKQHAIHLILMDVDHAEAIAKGRALAAAPPPKGPPKERDLSDEDWLRTQCAPVREQLEDPRHFDVEAIYYRRTREERGALRLSIRDIAAKARGNRYFELIGNDIRTMYVEHPNDWFVCNLCMGANIQKPECDHCRGNGYKIRYSGPKRR
jgi:hypothetical protein